MTGEWVKLKLCKEMILTSDMACIYGETRNGNTVKFFDRWPKQHRIYLGSTRENLYSL